MIFDGLLSEPRLDCCAGLCGAVRLLPLPLPTLSLLTKLAITKRVVLGCKHLRALIISRSFAQTCAVCAVCFWLLYIYIFLDIFLKHIYNSNQN